MNEQELQQKIEEANRQNDKLRKELQLIRMEEEYWMKLHHQFAGYAMNGILARGSVSSDKAISEEAICLADKLVEMLRDKAKQEKL